MALKRFDLAWIVVKDIEKSVKYFTETIGMHLHHFTKEHGWAELGGVEGGAILGVAQAGAHAPIPPGNNAVITLTVDNIVRSTKDLVSKGVNTVGDMIEVPNIVKLQLFQDPDGNYLQLVENMNEQ